MSDRKAKPEPERLGCGAPDQESPTRELKPGATVIGGRVVRAGEPVASAYVRLLDAGGEFTAEVQTGASGNFRFYAAPGDWTVRVLAAGLTQDEPLATAGGSTELDIDLR